MKMKQSVLAASITAALAIGAMGEAAAAVYAGSRLDVNNLNVAITPAAGASANTFNFELSNSATLNGASDFQQGTCGGFPSPGNNNCGAAPVLDAMAANAPGSAPTRVNNDMTFFGPGNSDYANSDSIIKTSQLTGGATTDTDNIAEANLATGTSASGSSQIQSITGFTFTFTLDNPGDLALTFDADPDLRAFIDAFEGGGSSAQANLNTSFTLTQDTGGAGFINWNPQGTAGNDCSASGGIACTETADTQDLNINVGATTPGTDSRHSYGAGDLAFGDSLTAFGISVTGLSAGSWTLTLNEQKSVNLQRGVAVPEPGILALLGIGLLGLGISGFRRKSV